VAQPINLRHKEQRNDTNQRAEASSYIHEHWIAE
jgi:hypothetical protein